MAQPNWKNRTLFKGDNLHVMRGMNSESVDLIYLDPPFNTNRIFSAPMGSKAAGASFDDAWTLTAQDEAWLEMIRPKYPAVAGVVDMAGQIDKTKKKSMKSYLAFMAVRLIECHRILKPTGSIYLHCDPTANSYLRILMDAIWGNENRRGELVWHYKNKLRDKRKRIWQSATDTIFFYTKTDGYIWNPQYEKLDKPKKYARIRKVNGKKVTVRDANGNVEYVVSHEKLMDNVLEMPMLTGGKERTGWPTQKPLQLIDRLVLASSDEGDMVFDPFAGCATTCISAEQLGRQWVGIDIDEEAHGVVIDRLQQAADKGLLARGHNTLRDVVLFNHSTDKGKVINKLSRSDQGDELKGQALKDHMWMVWGRQQEHCVGCKKKKDYDSVTIDHIIPQDFGGNTVAGNLQLLCFRCNARKNNRPMEYLLARNEEIKQLVARQVF